MGINDHHFPILVRGVYGCVVPVRFIRCNGPAALKSFNWYHLKWDANRLGYFDRMILDRFGNQFVTAQHVVDCGLIAGNPGWSIS